MGRLGALAAVVDELVAEDLDGLTDAVLAEQVSQVRRQLDRLEGRWLRALAAVDARGAAGAEHGVQAGSTAGWWLRHRLRMGPSAASSMVRTARALYRGPLTATAQALADGELSPALGGGPTQPLEVGRTSRVVTAALRAALVVRRWLRGGRLRPTPGVV